MTRKRAAVKYDKAETQQNIGYTHSPSESFLIQSFNHVQNIRRLYNRIPLKSNQELIVCEDGSIDGSLEAWDKRLQGRNEFMIRSNDLHEIRAYTRAADYARGNLLFFMQDDDIPPKSDWVEPVLEIFDQYPSLGLVGGFLPLAFGPFPDIDAYDLSGLNSLLEPDGNYYYRPHRDHPFPYSDTATGHKFIFCPAVNVGPFVVRNETYEQLGFDFDYSEAGMPGIEFDRDFSYRCWLNGWKVGYMPMGFAGYKGVSQVTGGTFQWGAEDRVEQASRNENLVVDRFINDIEDIASAVVHSNEALQPHRR